jgi:Putative Ig domain
MKSFFAGVAVGCILIGFAGCSGGTSGNPESAEPVAESDSGNSGSDGGLVILSVQVNPVIPFANNTLKAMVKARNPNQKPLEYRFQWQKNGSDISGEEGESLPSRYFGKGDEISVTVTASDGEDESDPFSSDPVTIQNSAPAVSALMILPNPGHSNEPLTAVAKVEDVDGDPATETYQWSKNGEELLGETGNVLEARNFTRGDVIEVSVNLSDGVAESGPWKSNPVEVRNSPPEISSSPNPSIGKNDVYTYQVTATDPDEDALTFSLLNGPDGMSIDERSGMVQWRVSKQDIGAHPVEIAVSDPDGAKSVQKYELRIFDLAKK